MGYFKGIKIDKKGRLWLKRKDGWTKAYCPYRSKIIGTKMGMLVLCGTWCVKFDEPYLTVSKEEIFLAICKGTLVCSSKDFIDEREEDNASNKNQTQENNGKGITRKAETA